MYSGMGDDLTVSPELALVDPELAARTRELLSDPDVTRAVLPPSLEVDRNGEHDQHLRPSGRGSVLDRQHEADYGKDGGHHTREPDQLARSERESPTRALASQLGAGPTKSMPAKPEGGEGHDPEDEPDGDERLSPVPVPVHGQTDAGNRHDDLGGEVCAHDRPGHALREERRLHGVGGMLREDPEHLEDASTEAFRRIISGAPVEEVPVAPPARRRRSVRLLAFASATTATLTFILFAVDLKLGAQ